MKSTRLAPLFTAALLYAPGALAHPHPKPKSPQQAGPAQAPPDTVEPGARGVTGQGALRFRVFMTAAHLPEEARKVVVSAHGGFAVDRREGKGETYFALPGAGVLRLSADFKQVTEVATAAEMKATNLHTTTIWYGRDGSALLSFPANDLGRIFTTALSGELLSTLGPPDEGDDLGLSAVRDYFAGGGALVPTDVAYLDGWLYITTGYSSLDYVLTARVTSERPLRMVWHDLAFGGRGASSRATANTLGRSGRPPARCPATSTTWAATPWSARSTAPTGAGAPRSTSTRTTAWFRRSSPRTTWGS
jgi:hypothetical protein